MLEGIRPKARNRQPDADIRWWEEKLRSTVGEMVWNAARKVDRDTSIRHRHLIIAGNMYGDSMPWAQGFTRPMGFIPEIASHNVVRQAADTFVSEVTQQPVRAEAETIDASWEDLVTCKKMSGAWDHLFRMEKFAAKMPRVVLDSCIYGRGFVRPFIDWQSQRVRLERTAPWQMLYDDRGCVDESSAPLERYMLRAIPRGVALKLWASPASGLSDYEQRLNRDAINNAGLPEVNAFQNEKYNEDLVGVCYAWHVGEADGRFAVAVDGHCLEQGAYPFESFPFADYCAFPPQGGMWGDSPVLMSAVTQANLNHLLTRIRRGQDAHGRIIVTTSGDAKAVRSKLHNDVALVLSMPGRGNIGHVAIPSVPGDIYNWVPELVSQIFSQFRISAMTANGQIPAGFRSGVAIRRYRELTSRAFVNPERAIGDLYCDTARLAVRLYRQMAEQVENPDDIEVQYRRWGGTHKIPWRQLDMDDAKMRIQPTPVSALSQGPAARVEELQELQNTGYLSASDAIRQMPFPDMDGVRRRLASADEYLEWVFESTLEENKKHDPIPELVVSGHFDKAMRMATEYIFMAERFGAPHSRVDKVREYVRGLKKVQTKVMQQMQAEAAAAAPPAPPAMPPGGPPPGPPPGPPGGPIPPSPEGMMPPGVAAA